jgi:putative transposase
MLWARMVAYVTGTVNQELRLRNEYLGAENRILIAQRLGPKALEELAAVTKPDTLLAWYRKLNRQQIRRIEVSPTSRLTAN